MANVTAPLGAPEPFLTVWQKACSSGPSVAFGISNVATLSTCISRPMSIPLGEISLARVSINSAAVALAKKCLKKLSKVTKLTDIVTSALAMFDMSVSKVLNDGKIDERSSTCFRRYTIDLFIICPMLIVR